MPEATVESTPAPVSQGTHHWVMTLDLPGRACVTESATWTPPPGTTRFDAYRQIRKHLAERHPDIQRAMCVFFSLEPNTL
ncbi:hypothetical protein [Streptomyces sp. NPDC059071]|uniref:hypothetical protein n=1 Tax=unclassified Streptomyces TaxID=2593676 RepID=UPI00365805A6